MMDKKDFLRICLEYNISTYVYQNPQSIQWARWLNAFEIHNSGTTNLFFNNDVILPGASKSVGGNYGEIYKGRLEVMFATPLPPVGQKKEVTITQKFYMFNE